MSAENAAGYLVYLTEKNVSWSWMASSIAVMRTAFDKLCHMSVTTGMTTPRRNWPLPETLSGRELRVLFDAMRNPRDRLLVALLSGCGLRVSEACRIRWVDFDRTAGLLRIEDPCGLRSRRVSIPAGLLPLFQGLVSLSRRDEPMIPGRCGVSGEVRSLSPRQAERLIKAGAGRAGILKRVTPRALCDTYAVRRLAAGDDVRTVQEALGHRSVETTLRYQLCLPPKVTSPADPPSPKPVLQELAAVLDRLTAIMPAVAQGP